MEQAVQQIVSEVEIAESNLLPMLNQSVWKHHDLLTESQLQNWAMIQLDDPKLVKKTLALVMDRDDLRGVPNTKQKRLDWAQRLVRLTLDQLDLNERS
jgi:hypothetical protein